MPPLIMKKGKSMEKKVRFKNISFYYLRFGIAFIVLALTAFSGINVSFDNGHLSVNVNQKVYADSSTILSDGFEAGTGNWTLDGSFVTTIAQAHSGSSSLSMNVTGDVYHQFTPSEIASPYRDVIFWWYPTTTTSLFDTSIASFEEGSFTTTDKSIEMFWTGSANTTYFRLYTYLDGVRTSTTTSATTSITANTWHKLEFTSNTTATQIKIDDVAVTFGGVDHSTVLTNGYNWLRLSASSGDGIEHSQTMQVNADTDDCTVYWNGSAWVFSYTSNYVYVGQTIGIEKMGAGLRFSSAAIPTGSTINTANLTITCKQASSTTTVNGVVTGDLESNAATFHTLADYQARRGTIVGGADNNKITTANVSWNNIGAWSVNGTYSSPDIKSVIQEIVNQAGWSSSSPIVLFLDDHAGTSTMNSYRTGHAYGSNATMAAELNIDYTASVITYYIDDVSVFITPVIDTTNLYSRTLSATVPSNPGGTNNIQLIYGYLINRDAASLSAAQTAANTIQSLYNGGNKSLPYVKEMAILSKFDPTRLTLLNNLADLVWTYQVNQTTKLPYDSINSAGQSTDNICSVSDPGAVPSVIDSFIEGYLATNNTTFLSHAEDCLTAVNTYMRHPTYDTITFTANATNGAIIDSRSRGGVSVAPFIETAMYLYSVSGNVSFLDMAEYQAQKYIQYAWDGTVQAFRYRPDDTGFEDFTPEMSQALMYVYEATGNSTYMTYAEENFNSYMTYFLRNGLTHHYFLSTGQDGHGPAHFADYIPAIAAKLYKYTGNTTYLAMSDNYTCLLIDYFFGTNSDMFNSDNFTQYSVISYEQARLYQSELLYRFIMPTTGVSISWDYGNDLYGRYLSLANAPIDVSFESNAVHLYNVSGTGHITFASGINTVYIHYGGVDYTVDVSSSHQVDLPLVVIPLDAVNIAMDATGHTSGSFSGNLTDLGGAPSADVNFEWCTDNLSWDFLTTPVSVNATGIFTVSIPADWTPSWTYYFRARCDNIAGAGYGSSRVIALTMPTVIVNSTIYSGTTATLSGNVTALGVATSAYLSFLYDFGGSSTNTTETTTSGLGEFHTTIDISAYGGATLNVIARARVGSVYSLSSTDSTSVPSVVSAFAGLSVVIQISAVVLFLSAFSFIILLIFREVKQGERRLIFIVMMALAAIILITVFSLVISGLLPFWLTSLSWAA